MTPQNPSDQKTFKNTFALHMENKELTVHEIILGLKTTLLHSEDLPQDVQDAVEVELEKQRTVGNRC